MSEILQKLESMRSQYLQDLAQVSVMEDLENLRVKLLGKKGELTAVLRSMGSLSNEERPLVGGRTNEIRQELESFIQDKMQDMKRAVEERRIKQEKIDITLPSQGQAQGGVHPITQVIEEIENIFIGMGYTVVDGPEVEWAKLNFDSLRIPEGHPARSEKDTFYVADEVILRTQTSPVQIRVMQESQLPIKIIAPGRVYRPDTPDATHSPIFHQIEGLVVDKGVAMSDLVGTLKLFAQKLFGENTQIRLRPHHFPFTEPSCEVDVTCWNCKGAGCRTCKGEGFVEVLGAGMVHPWVLENAGIDPNVYSGFAFGIGVERTAMARFKVEDIRYFYENNLQFLKQFK